MEKEKLSGKEVYEFWQNGKTLIEAAEIYCDKNNIKNSLKENKNNDFYKYERNILENLTNKIISGELLSIGYDESAVGQPFPDLFSLSIWPPDKINFKSSSIVYDDVIYSSVRINKSPTTNKIISSLNNKVGDKQIGRPSKKNNIIEAYEYLKKEENIDYSKTLKSHTEIIQKTVQSLHPNIEDTAGMQHEAIRRAIGERFKTDKEKL